MSKEKLSIKESIYLYVSTIYNRVKKVINTYWLKVCRKFKIFKLKPFKEAQDVLDYLNSKGFKYEYQYEYQKDNHAHAFFFTVGKSKIGNAFWAIEELNKHNLDYFHRTMINFYLSDRLNKQYKDKIKAKTRGVPTSTVFIVERVKTADGIYNVSCHKNGRGGFNVVQYEKVS